MIGLVYYWRVYQFMMTDSKAVTNMEFSYYETFAYYVTNSLCFVIVLSLIFHTVFLFKYLFSNLTQLERMMGYQLRGIVCATDKKQKLENPYDMLPMYNLTYILGDSFWMWPIPIGQARDGQGFYFAKIPEVPMNIKTVLREKETEKLKRKLEEDPALYVQEALRKYSEHNLIVN